MSKDAYDKVKALPGTQFDHETGDVTFQEVVVAYREHQKDGWKFFARTG